MKVSSYDRYRQYLRGFKNGHLNLLVIHGRPGKGKTEIARSILPDAQYIRGGNVSEFKLYCELYQHRDEDFIFDDLDRIHRRAEMVRLLKALCDTRCPKEIRWVTAAGALKAENIPTKFETNSRLVMICNDWRNLNENIDALENRGDVIEFAPPAEALHQYVMDWFHDNEITNFIGQHLLLARERLSARDYTLSVGRRQAGLDWKRCLLDGWQIDPDDALVLRLLEDSTLTMQDRARLFRVHAVGGKSERRFYYLYKRLRQTGSAQKPLQFCSDQTSPTAKLQPNSVAIPPAVAVQAPVVEAVMDNLTAHDAVQFADNPSARFPDVELIAEPMGRGEADPTETAERSLPAPSTPILATPRAKMNGKPVFEVAAKSVINFHSGFGHKLLCDDLTFSLGSACAYKCRYCYVGPMMAKSPHLKEVHEDDPAAKHEEIVIRRSGALATLRRQLTDRHGDPKFGDDARVIYASPLVDVAANSELVDETVEACRIILGLTRWHIRLLSKSHSLPAVAQALDSPDARARLIFGVSTGTLDDTLARSFECGTALVSKRLQSLHWLQGNGWRTFAMLCPSLPQRDYAKFAGEMAAAIRFEKCEHIWAEVMNVRGKSLVETASALRESGYNWEAAELERVAKDKTAWEQYARDTFLAHAKIYDGSGKLRYLQYVAGETRDWWVAQQGAGAIVL